MESLIWLTQFIECEQTPGIMKIAVLGNYPPRKCGIATFTENLINSILKASRIHRKDLEIEVIAMNDCDTAYDYPKIVTKTIQDNNREEYLLAAQYVNQANFDLCLVQHEYGIFGGESGLLLLNFLQELKIPIVATCHTILTRPSFHQREILKKIAAIADRIVVMNSMAIGFLAEIYDVPRHKVVHIQHGVPDFSNFHIETVEKPQNWEGKTIMLTFGLLGRSKGIETVIKALPGIIKKHPELHYVVLGKTHPHVLKHAGEEYRDYLQNLSATLKVEQNVTFLNQYVIEEDLMNYLLAADIYVTPYLNKAQITSGTLSYAVSGGCAVVSTPYWHAEELLADGRGRLFDFNDYTGLANVVNDIMDHPAEMAKLKKNAFEYGLSIAWPRIGYQYIQTFENLNPTQKTIQISPMGADNFQMPDFSLSHLERLTDDNGIVQHATGCIANYRTGYCLDDNSRALIVSTMAYHRFMDEKYYPLIYRYLAFLMYMQNENGSFKDTLTYLRGIEGEITSDDAHGRVIWALGYLIRFAPCDSFFHISHDLFHKSLEYLDHVSHQRGFANTIFGIYHYIRRFPDQEQFIKKLENIADKLVEKYNEHKTNGWHWFEPVLTYDNGLIPAALYQAYEITENKQYFKVAEESRKFLESKCLFNGHLTLVGNKEWPDINKKKHNFAQQPLDALAMLIMYESLWRITGEKSNVQKMKLSFEWFLGKNDLNLPLFDPETNGCNDGLEEVAVNRNQGAESTISYLMSWLIVEPYLVNMEEKITA